MEFIGKKMGKTTHFIHYVGPPLVSLLGHPARGECELLPGTGMTQSLLTIRKHLF